MPAFATLRLAPLPDAIAPDGSQVRTLLRLGGGSLAHFELAPGLTSHAVAHRRVEEIWYILGGRGEMWRKAGAEESVVTVEPGVTAVAITMPPWPGDAEAYRVEGKWR